MRLPGSLQAEYALRGVWAALIGGLVLVLAGFAGLQTARLEGFKVWPIEIEGAKPRAERLTARIDAMKSAQTQAQRLAKQERVDNEEEYRGIAERVDREAKVDLTVEMDAADRYIAANRVWQWPEGIECGDTRTAAGSDRARYTEGTGPAAELDGPEAGFRAGARRNGLVVVSEEDIRICTANTIKAEAAHDWALQVEAASRSGGDGQ